MKLSNQSIYLLGFAGTGKLTIARALALQAPFTVVDNHLINNPVFRVIGADGVKPLPEEVWIQTGRVRDAVFETIRTLSPSDSNFIFTNDLIANDPQDDIVYDRVIALARARRSNLLVVRLLCEPKELARRIRSEDRKANLKSLDSVSALERSSKMEVLIPKSERYIDLDVTKLPPNEAAKFILSKLGNS